MKIKDITLNQSGIEIFVVYFNPKDFPGEYVIRRNMAYAGAFSVDPNVLCRGKTLESVRSHIPRDKILLARHPSDDPVIVETWI